jgi:DNA-binding CsgD family transcriptional regulator
MAEKTIRCRIHLLARNSAEAARATDVVWQHVSSTGQYAEFLACRALAVGMLAKKRERPLALLALAEKTSRENEAVLLCKCVRALLALDRDAADARSIISSAFQLAVAKGVIDPLAFALRYDDRLAALVGEIEDLRPALKGVLAIVDGPGTEKTNSPAALQPFQEAHSLTNREREVLQLVAEGKTNLEIATRLFLTAATVKAHVRNILRKLGARSRTEAAIYALRMQQHEVEAHGFQTRD